MRGRLQKAVTESRIALDLAMGAPPGTDLSYIQSLALNKAWSIAEDTLDFIARLIDQVKPQFILEFGSGVSTIFMALCCQKLSPDCLLISIDHDPEYAKSTARQLQVLAVEAKSRLQVAPLVVRDFGGKHLPAYFLEEADIAVSMPADLVLIDGPPLILGGREGVLYQAMSFVRPGTIILLDDANRTQELETIAKWQDNLGEAIEVKHFQNFAKGLAAIVVRQPVTREKLWFHRLNLTSKEIAGIIPRRSRVILVDETQWTGSLDGDIRIIPFLEHRGQYWGAPPDDQVAVSELERLRAAGAEFLVFGWPAFWWFSHYRLFHEYLNANFPCVLQNDRLVVFDLRDRALHP
jgi:predicted O-methyltransferase YrrM